MGNQQSGEAGAGNAGNAGDAAPQAPTDPERGAAARMASASMPPTLLLMRYVCAASSSAQLRAQIHHSVFYIPDADSCGLT